MNRNHQVHKLLAYGRQVGTPFDLLGTDENALTFALGDTWQAIQDYSRAITLDPAMAQAYYNRGLCYNDLSEYPQALQDFNAALRLDPRDPDFYRARAEVHTALGNKGHAMVDDEKAAGLE